MALGKRTSTDDPLTEHDVAERLSHALLRVWRLAEEVTADPRLHREVTHSRYLSVPLDHVLDVLNRLAFGPVCEHAWIVENEIRSCTRCGLHDYGWTPPPSDRTAGGERDGATESHDRTRVISDGFGSEWPMCDRTRCGLHVVRPGKVQCWCDDPDAADPDALTNDR